MTDDRFDPSHGRGAQLVLHRPAALTAGALRRIHIHLDGQHITDLARDDTAHVSGPAMGPGSVTAAPVSEPVPAR